MTALWVLILFAPMAFGAVEWWALTVCGVAVLAGLWAARIGPLLRHGEVYLPRHLALIGTAAMIAVPIVQLVPGPWQTLVPHATQLDLRRWLIYGGAFLLAVTVVREPRDLRRLVFVMTIAGAAIGLLGLAQMLTGAKQIYWFRTVVRPGWSAFFGPYVNENDFAGAMELLAPIALGGAAWAAQRPAHGVGDLREHGDTPVRRAGWTRGPAPLYLLAAALMTAAMFASLSRGGIVCLVCGLALFAILTARSGHDRRRRIAVSALAALVVVMMATLGVGPTIREMRTLVQRTPDGNFVGRFRHTSSSFAMFLDHPVIGTGTGTFEFVFPAYKHAEDSHSVRRHAHNDYAQYAAETGLVGIAALALAVGPVLAGTRRFLRRRGGGRPRLPRSAGSSTKSGLRRSAGDDAENGLGSSAGDDAENGLPRSAGSSTKTGGVSAGGEVGNEQSQATRLSYTGRSGEAPPRAMTRRGAAPVVHGCLAGLFAFALHQVGDFNFHIPANALLFGITAGMTLAAFRMTMPRGVERDYVTVRMPRRWRWPVGAVAAVLSTGFVVSLVRPAVGEWLVRRVRAADVEAPETGVVLERATRWDPRNPEWLYLYAVHLAAVGDPDAVDWVWRAIGRHSRYADAWSLAAWLMAEEGLIDEAWDAHRTALVLNPKRPVSHYRYAMFLLDRSREAEGAEAEALLADARAHAAEAVEMDGNLRKGVPGELR